MHCSTNLSAANTKVLHWTEDKPVLFQSGGSRQECGGWLAAAQRGEGKLKPTRREAVHTHTHIHTLTCAYVRMLLRSVVCLISLISHFMHAFVFSAHTNTGPHAAYGSSLLNQDRCRLNQTRPPDVSLPPPRLSEDYSVVSHIVTRWEDIG